MSWLDRWQQILARLNVRLGARWGRGPRASSDSEVHDPELDALLDRARSLPRSVEPARDLWHGVENRIAGRAGEIERPRWSLTSLFPRPLAAAGVGALLVAMTALSVFWIAETMRLPGGSAIHSDAEVAAIALTLRERDGVSDVHRSIVTILEAHRTELSPETVAVLDENLRSIDRAIAEIHLALESNPDANALRFLLAEAYRSEADLLERLEWWLDTPQEATS